MHHFPITPSIFRTQYFEKQFVYLANAIPNIHYTWNDFSIDFFGIDPSDRRVRLFNNGELSKERYCSLAQDGPQVRSFYKPGVLEQEIEDGGTLVVSNFERASKYVAGICNQYAELTDSRCAGNAYVANGGDGTFGKHWDTHCVFATQLIGRKLWRVYRPTQELPLQFQTSRDIKHECSDIPIFEKILEPGDILYLPRGWWHEATPLANTPTLHIAAGIYTTKIFEYLRWIVESRMPQILNARRSMHVDTAEDLMVDVAIELEKEILSSKNKEAFIINHMQLFANHVHVDFQSIFQKFIKS